MNDGILALMAEENRLIHPEEERSTFGYSFRQAVNMAVIGSASFLKFLFSPRNQKLLRIYIHINKIIRVLHKLLGT